MLHRVRHSLGLNNQPTGKLEGTCEADETYIGGQEKNKHQSDLDGVIDIDFNDMLKSII